MKTVSPLPKNARFGACVKCGSSSSKRDFFDLGVFIEFEGELYVCDACVKEMASVIGLVDTKIHENVKSTNKNLLANNKELRTRVEEQAAVIDSLSQERVVRAAEQQTELERARIEATQETEARYAKATQ